MNKALLIYTWKDLWKNKWWIFSLVLSIIYQIMIVFLLAFKVLSLSFLYLLALPTIIYLALVLISWIFLIQTISKMKAGQYQPTLKIKNKIKDLKYLFSKKTNETQIANKILQIYFYQLIFLTLLNIIMLFIIIALLLLFT